MSAIAGIVSLSGKSIDVSLIDRLTLSMTARGPDRRQTWQTERVALGHCLLRTTPEALHEEQPTASVDGHLRIVFDGRLDNRSELFRELRARSVAIRDETDPALVLAAYSLWGEKAPERLLGDFAFAIWDSREKQVFCARDHIGNRPYYYVQTADFFAFASQDDALLKVPGVRAVPNDLMVASGLVAGVWAGLTECNWLRDVHTLKPACSATVQLSNGSVAWRCYWAPRTDQAARFASIDEAAEAFRDVFTCAIRDRLRSNSPPAALFSGGMDSASIAATMSKLQKSGEIGQIHAYSAVHDDPAACVETRKIMLLAKHCSDVHHIEAVPSFQGEVAFETFESFMFDKPHPINTNRPIIALMCLMAQNHGHRVLLHGASGDVCNEIGASYLEHHVGHLTARELLCEARLASQHHSYVTGRSAFGLMFAAIARHLLPSKIRSVLQLIKFRFHRDLVKEARVSEHFAFAAGLREQIEARLTANLRRDPYSVSSRRLDAIFPIGIVQGLDSYNHIAGRAGVEMRDPYADRRVVEFFLSLPPTLLAWQGWTKYLVRRSFAQDLPRDVVWSVDKSHLGVWAIDRMFQPALNKMRQLDSAALDEFDRIFSKKAATQAKLLISGPQLADDVDQAVRRELAHDRFPLALWAAGLQTDSRM